ncbi:melatonin receptor type 1A-like [Styela clava]
MATEASGMWDSTTTLDPGPHPVIITTTKHWWIPQVEIPFLILIILVGLIGNISIIGAIVLEKKLKFVGNAFIVNLAVADLIVTAYVVPGILANEIADKNLFSLGACNFTALIVSVSCLASMYSLMCVAINRYIAVAHSNWYTDLFTKKKVAIFIGIVWIWSFVLSIPPAFGWGDYKYHGKIHICMYDCNTKFFAYTTTFISLSIFVPFTITCLCYLGVYLVFNKNRSRVRSMSNGDRKRSGTTMSTTETGTEIKRNKSRKSTKRENNEKRLVVTLFAAVVLFTICWVPYALIILINHDAPAIYKRSAAWLAFTNSAMNSILYGLLNRNFRTGYKKMWARVFSCCSCISISKKMLGETSATKSTSFYSLSNHRTTKMKSGIVVDSAIHSTTDV